MRDALRRERQRVELRRKEYRERMVHGLVMVAVRPLAVLAKE